MMQQTKKIKTLSGAYGFKTKTNQENEQKVYFRAPVVSRPKQTKKGKQKNHWITKKLSLTS
jgi:hypothetical protein